MQYEITIQKLHLMEPNIELTTDLHILSNVILIRYDTIEEFNVDSKAECSAESSTRSQKKI